MSFDAYIFDFDGVLCNSSRVHKSAFIEALRQSGYNYCVTHQNGWCACKDAIYESLKDKKTSTKLRSLADAGFIYKEHIDKINALKQQLTLKHIASLKFDRDVYSTLIYMKGLKAIAIASDASRQTIDEFLAANKARGLFDVIVTSADVAGRVKPLPDVYIRVLNELNVTASRAVVFEDTIDGMCAARQAGINVVEHCSYENLRNKLAMYTGDDHAL